MSAPNPTGVGGKTVDMYRQDTTTYGVTQYGQSNVAALSLPLVQLTDDEQSLFDRLRSNVTAKKSRLGLQVAASRRT